MGKENFEALRSAYATGTHWRRGRIRVNAMNDALRGRAEE